MNLEAIFDNFLIIGLCAISLFIGWQCGEVHVEREIIRRGYAEILLDSRGNKQFVWREDMERHAISPEN